MGAACLRTHEPKTHRQASKRAGSRVTQVSLHYPATRGVQVLANLSAIGVKAAATQCQATTYPPVYQSGNLLSRLRKNLTKRIQIADIVTVRAEPAVPVSGYVARGSPSPQMQRSAESSSSMATTKRIRFTYQATGRAREAKPMYHG
jgi:hypothetical protein